ncbi:thioesterase II family protein [Streptomyces hoynatensis]|uniref:Thioesterase n=1 Tax=Streptomyces hoynatensis TaxID=1141874 RepID=A0A3A9Z1A0_9ACTN|nr:alpha/beta fold hydrolase [Streptomyces hoynatensis]RKN41186.1 thioesterase [Streptomyces hoynatensis]
MIPARVDVGLWLRRFHTPAPNAPRLVCFPHAGGSASWYHPMSATLSPGLEVYAVQYPARQDRRTEAADYEIGDLAESIAEAVAKGLLEGPRRPLLFFGHSMGAVLGFETARALARRGLSGPDHLVASGRRSPTTHREERVHQRDDAGVLRELRELDGTDGRLLQDEEIVRMAMPSIRADYRAIETYRPRDATPVSCPITVLTGDADPKTTVEEALAWKELTTGGFASKVFPGGHFFLVQHQQAVYELLRSLAAEAAVAG